MIVRTRSGDYVKRENELFEEISSNLIKGISVSSRLIEKNYIVYYQEGKILPDRMITTQNVCKSVQT